MKYFSTVNDLANPAEFVQNSLALKKKNKADYTIGRGKTLGLLFFNASLRTRISTQKAALTLGMQVIVVNVGADSWTLEFEDGAVMNAGKTEHVKDAAAILGLYCDILAVRCFPGLVNREEDYSEKILLQFMRYSNIPVISLESATLHPLQSLADLITIEENKKSDSPKIVLTWAPHVKPLPQVVANSFSEWVLKCNYNLTIALPKGYELCEDYTKGARIVYNQEEAMKDADFVYVKNWSSYQNYGNMPAVEGDWYLSNEKLAHSRNAKIMHCLPVRRNVELSDALLDGANSLIHEQAKNRVHAAEAVLLAILEKNFK